MVSFPTRFTLSVRKRLFDRLRHSKRVEFCVGKMSYHFIVDLQNFTFFVGGPTVYLIFNHFADSDSVMLSQTKK